MIKVLIPVAMLLIISGCARSLLERQRPLTRLFSIMIS